MRTEELHTRGRRRDGKGASARAALRARAPRPGPRAHRRLLRRHLRPELPDDQRADGHQVFHKGAGAYGLLGSVMAIGSLAGALLAARRGRPALRLVVGAASRSASSRSSPDCMPTYLVFAAGCPCRPAALTVMTAANATMQLSVGARDARPGHGAVHDDLHGRDPDGRADHRLGRRGVRRSLDPDRGWRVALLGTLAATGAYAWRHDLVVRAHFGWHPGLDVLTREQRDVELDARSLVG